jgi:hypothetical protein
MLEKHPTLMTGPVAPVCIVILNWNGWKDTIQCLESIFQSKPAHFCCLVVDNGSDDNSSSELQHWALARLRPTDWALVHLRGPFRLTVSSY